MLVDTSDGLSERGDEQVDTEHQILRPSLLVATATTTKLRVRSSSSMDETAMSGSFSRSVIVFGIHQPAYTAVIM